MADNEDMADYADALDHIMRVANASRTDTRRLRWIAHRAKCALEGGDWRGVELPSMTSRGDQRVRIMNQAKEIRLLKKQLLPYKQG